MVDMDKGWENPLTEGDIPYMAAAYNGILIPLIVITQALFQMLQIASNWWMAWANPLTEGDKPRTSNVVSSDQSVVDCDVAFRLCNFTATTVQLLGIVVVMMQVTWQVLLLIIPVTVGCLWMQKYYMSSSRELVRIVSIQKSPIFNLFGESISGAATIRGSGQEKRFMKRSLHILDYYARPFFYNVAIVEWLCLRMELVSTFVFAFLLILLVSFPRKNIDPSFCSSIALAGLAVTYGLQLSARLSRWILSFCKLENKIISIERIYQYCHISSEAPAVIEDNYLPPSWPKEGTIEIVDLGVSFSYFFGILSSFLLTYLLFPNVEV